MQWYYFNLICFPLQLINNSKQYLRPLSSIVGQSQTLAQSPVVQQHQKPTLLPAIRGFQTSPVTRDIDSAAKFIGAGAATVGVAGSGQYCFISFIINTYNTFFLTYHDEDS